MVVYQRDALAPHITGSAWLADNAQVMGDVHRAADSSVWFSNVLHAVVGIPLTIG
jgi:carbonic anhydrase/acetyltransferase-like protein (isoleucine patch superfamily)